ncbi:hypothetical protein C8A01DRAFT_36598 [Parachaetomium inaequale]|uniref:Fucose-specific lectin n=1 Tax=Parachaetomium inaequale TaxID=2588326 RepID=A0AAN6PEW9_9PEZI|nr:hypothetical protein C8A01DRAFT_36598 [Parachaetomium inaequale]
MDLRYGLHGASEQPGLEVVSHPGLEAVVDRHSQTLPEVRPDHSSKEAAASAYASYPEHYKSPVSDPLLVPAAPGTPDHGGRKKRLWLIVGGVVAVVVILAAVLGGVLGSRAASSSGESSASQTGESSRGSGDSGDAGNSGNSGNSGDAGDASNTGSNTTARPQSIRQGSGLSVAGWRKPDGSAETYLFFQDPEDGLRFSRCDTSLRSPGNDSTCWASPVSFNAYATAGTPLGASTILWGDDYQPQIELFYSGFKTRLLGVNFNEQKKPNTTDDDVNKQTLFTGLGSSLTAYWPWTVYQDPAGKLYHLRNRIGGRWEPNGLDWDANPINITALATTRLAMAPTSTNYTMIAQKAGYAIFYQTLDAKLAVSIPDLDSPKRPATFHNPWPTTLPDVTFPKLAPIAAFSVARKDDDLQRVDTYVLYLDADANINVLSTTTGASAAWNTPAQPDALKGADKDTDIACLNMATSSYNAAKAAVLLEAVSGGEARCFFQKGGQVVEVRLDGETGEWVGVGGVPMP